MVMRRARPCRRLRCRAMTQSANASVMRNSSLRSGAFSKRDRVGCEARSSPATGSRPTSNLWIGSQANRAASLASSPHPEQWLLIEWPNGENEPTKYWVSTEAADTPLRELVKLAKHRAIIERDYEELKQALGLGHYEGRGWRGFHHHATLCIAAYGFLAAARSRFSPSARADRL